MALGLKGCRDQGWGGLTQAWGLASCQNIGVKGAPWKPAAKIPGKSRLFHEVTASAMRLKEILDKKVDILTAWPNAQGGVE